VKSYFTKIYQPNGDYIDTLKNVNFSGFRKQINGGLGELVFSIPKKFDDFDENYLIKLNNKIDVWVSDSDTGSDGLKIYSGYISQYEPYIEGQEEGVNVRCLGYVTKLKQQIARDFLGSSAYVQLITRTVLGLRFDDDPSDEDEQSAQIHIILAGLLNLYNGVYSESTSSEGVKNPYILNDTSQIEQTTNTMKYVFNTFSFFDIIEKCREYSPANWWWYIGADNILQFKAKPTQATHTFTFGKDFKNIKVEKNMESIVNNVLFSSVSDDILVPSILRLYKNQESEDLYDDRWEIITDSRVKETTTADNKGNSRLLEKKDADVRVMIEILDNNGSQTGYDIESINPGDTCKFVGFNDITSQTFTDNMQIVGVEYSANSVRLEIESLKPSVSRELQKNTNKLNDRDSELRDLTSYTIV